MPVTCCAVACSLKVTTLITANSARKSPKTEMICAYQRRRISGMRRTAPIDNGAGISGSIAGSATAGPVELSLIIAAGVDRACG